MSNLMQKTGDLVFTVNVDAVGHVEPGDEELPCGCGMVLKYREFSHTTYTPEGIEVRVPRITGYRCNNCGLVILLPEVSDQLYDRIDTQRREHGLLPTSPNGRVHS